MIPGVQLIPNTSNIALEVNLSCTLSNALQVWVTVLLIRSLSDCVYLCTSGGNGLGRASFFTIISVPQHSKRVSDNVYRRQSNLLSICEAGLQSSRRFHAVISESLPNGRTFEPIRESHLRRCLCSILLPQLLAHPSSRIREMIEDLESFQTRTTQLLAQSEGSIGDVSISSSTLRISSVLHAKQWYRQKHRSKVYDWLWTQRDDLTHSLAVAKSPIELKPQLVQRSNDRLKGPTTLPPVYTVFPWDPRRITASFETSISRNLEMSWTIVSCTSSMTISCCVLSCLGSQKYLSLAQMQTPLVHCRQRSRKLWSMSD